ncbi:hypothetical protein P691DRAFT_759873 [Macrolepiota fuliginosa MF-IS2]|uniref:Uncharacterized protein n=1 Tax=Macrolepiota fuliginosa MF-IS2 TaxID=1400762 RepID=A0A9P5XD70_9AGAR|nr:hypothetical protein P691DRAFT_759873 [Macrolepiota fuliginosa MF-IS2]
MSSHPIEQGFYLIRYQGDIKVIQDVVASAKSDLAAIYIGGDVDFTRKLWHVTYWGHGYKFKNVHTGEYAYAPYITKNGLVHLTSDEEKAAVWDIQADGKNIWRIVVPEHDLYWTRTVLMGGQDPANVKLIGSDGKKDQMFNFERFYGPQ